VNVDYALCLNDKERGAIMRERTIQSLVVLLLFTVLPCTLFAQQAPGSELNQPEAQLKSSPDMVSLEIKGMDIIDVLKILAIQGNLNIVAGKNVRGKVTVFLKNVKVMDALEIILAANELAYEKKGNIINVMSDKDYEALYGEKSYDKKDVKIIRLNFARAQAAGNALNQIKSKIGKVIVDEASNTIVLIDTPQSLAAMQRAVERIDLPVVTKTFVLNYAKAKDLEEKIRESLTNNIGEVKIDERMNKVVVTDLPTRVDYIAEIISAFDERDKVVLIEAKIVQITLNKEKSYGINWNNIFAGIDTIAASDLSINLPSGVSSWPTTFTYNRAHGATDYGDRVILKLLEQLGKTDVLSTPQITVANNQEAKVLVGTKEAYVTSTITQSDGATTTADNVQFVDVGVRLSVCPTITDDGFINMKIKPEVSSAPTSLELTNADGSTRTKVPIVSTAEAETQLLVKDGTTIIMAGLMKDTRKDNTEKIPVLGDVPLLGHFFRSRGKENQKTELVIFLTPHIIKETEEFSEDAEEYLYQHEQAAFSADQDNSAYRQYVKRRPKGPVKKSRALLSRGSVSSVSTELVVPLLMYHNEDFRQYCNYIDDRIKRFLEKNRPRPATKQKVQLVFVLTCDGYLKHQPSVLSDVDDKIKDSIIRSIQEASPFFPFPQNYNEPEEIFRLAVSFEESP
jgi:type II secretory pathway component GspD/PulD (secretin)